MRNHKNENGQNVRPNSSSRLMRSKSTASDLNREGHYTIADYHRELQMATPDKKPITQTSSQIELANKYANNNRVNEYKIINPNEISIEPSGNYNKEEIKIVEGHWKDQLLGREYDFYIHLKFKE